MPPSIWRICKSRNNTKLPAAPDKSSKHQEAAMAEISIPTHFQCPISLDLMKDPVTASSGITYDRRSIERWLDMGNTACPVTNHPIAGGDLIPNHAIRRLIQAWCVANRSLGVDRIPTPRTPLTKTEAAQILSEIAATTQTGDQRRCLQLVMKLRDLARESERNKQCISSSGACRVLASSFDAFSRPAGSAAVAEEILAAMAVMLPLDGDSCANMASKEALNSLVRILRHGDLSGRLNAAVMVKELLHPSKAVAAAVATTDGLVGALVGLVKEPISTRATKDALVASFYLISSSQSGAARFVELGMVHLALEILVDAERSVAEKALGVVDGLCGTEEGRRQARGHALAVPVLVKKMLRVSDAATQFAVSALWKLCGEGARDGCLQEAVQVGAFQKLLLVLQMGCGERTKEKVKELLKLLNGYKGKSQCLESADFKDLKRTF